jgi:GNAT superfamily N-acetyltransferase
LTVRPVRTRRDRYAFLGLPYRLYRDDPHWIPPLRLMEKRRWARPHNSSLERLRVERFIAWRGSTAVGRVAVVVDPLFDRWVPDSGFFGFFECEPEPVVASALLDRAEAVLQDWGKSVIVGPVNHTTHEEVGLLAEGERTAPALLTPYNPPVYNELLERAGYCGIRDYQAFDWTPTCEPSPALLRLASVVDTDRGQFRDVRFRSLDPARFEHDVRLLHDLYNSAFRDVWGFVEISWPEFLEQAESFRAFFRPDLVVLAEQGNAIVGFSLVLPDINTVLADLDGRLLPLGWLKLMIRRSSVRSGRFVLLGVRPDRVGRAIAPAMVLEIRERVIEAALDRIEVSLVQSENRRMLRIIDGLGCQPTRLYRLYAKEFLPAVGRSGHGSLAV